MAEKKCPPKGSPKWMATFADMSTLLLTFFVLMLSFANIDVQKFRDLLGSVQNAFGVNLEDRGQYMPLSEEESPESADELMDNELKQQQQVQQQKMVEQIEKVIDENQLKEFAEIKGGEEGVRIRITGQLMFSLGKADIRPQAFKFLDGIVEAMKNSDYYLLVEGHTDSLKISTFLYPSNWELSSARASAVLRYLIKEGIDPKRLSGIGHAYNFPIANNKTEAGRNLNRRVEFLLTHKPFRSDQN